MRKKINLAVLLVGLLATLLGCTPESVDMIDDVDQPTATQIPTLLPAPTPTLTTIPTPTTEPRITVHSPAPRITVYPPTISPSPSPTTDWKITLNPPSNSTRDEDDLIAFKDYDAVEYTVTIFLVHPDGSNMTELVTFFGGLLGRNYSWSPDGKQIAFSHAPQEGLLLLAEFQIFTLDIHSGELFQVTNCFEECKNPVWSPNGERIAFRNGEEDFLSTVAVDGSDMKLVSEDPRVGAYFSWSPDGTQIAYSIGQPPFDYSIWLADIDRENEHQFETEYLDIDTEYDYAAIPVWTPDDNHLILLKQHDHIMRKLKGTPLLD